MRAEAKAGAARAAVRAAATAEAATAVARVEERVGAATVGEKAVDAAGGLAAARRVMARRQRGERTQTRERCENGASRLSTAERFRRTDSLALQALLSKAVQAGGGRFCVF